MVGKHCRRKPIGPYVNCGPSDADLKVLAHIEEQVQNPPDGLILPGALLWEVRIQPSRGAHGRAVKMQVCFIPTARQADFVHGVEASSGMGRSTFVCREVRPWRGDRKPTPTTGLLKRR